MNATNPKSRAEAMEGSAPMDERLQQIHGKSLSAGELATLEEMNSLYCHSLLSGKHFIARQRYSAAEGMMTVFEPLSEFKNYFLHLDKIAGMNPGKAWLCWPGKSYRPGGVTFQPNTKACPSNVFNLWQGFKVVPEKGDCGPFLHHVRQAICGGDEEVNRYLLQWLAHMLQKPDEKPSVAVLLKSVEGTGKGTLARPFGEILGQHFVQLNGDDQLTGRFNSIVANRLMVFADEVKLTDTRTADKLKALISEPTVSMERKKIDPEPIPNFARFIFSSNHDHVLLAGQRERRYLVVEPDARYAQNEAHFSSLYRWLKKGGARYLLNYLMTLDIRDFNPHKAPVTRGLIAEKLQSMKPVQQWCYEWLEKVSTGEPMPARIGGAHLARKFRDWASDNRMEDVTQRSAETQVGNLLRSMGITKSRHDPRTPRYYNLPEAVEFRGRFAGILGHSEEEVFSEL
ncbi:MAG: DUF5906 domain-containing protein [Shewanella sp.]|nr:DUF5906 domain-containing protein [Shewanella sp.]